MNNQLNTLLCIAYWLAAVLLSAWMQGWLMPAIRRTPAGPEAKRQAFALHAVGALAYFLPWVFVPTPTNAALAALTRLVFFDACLNYFSGRPAFEVSQTAAFDKFLRKLAPAHPERLRLGLWLASLVAYAGAALVLFWIPAT